MKKSLSLKDVSQRLGVSTATISNAFNRPDQLSKKLRQHILNECKELGYTGPSLVARSLRSGQTDVIGVMFSDSLSYSFLDPMAAAFMAGISDTLALNNKQLLLLSDTSESPAQMRAESLPDGIIFYGEPRGHSIERIKNAGKQCFLVDFEYDGIASININNYQACFQLAKSVIQSSDETIAVIGMRLMENEQIERLTSESLEFSSKAIATSRLKGFLEGAEESGNKIDLNNVVYIPVNSKKYAEQAARLLLLQENRPDIIFCMSDIIAIEVCRVAKELNINVPQDLQVTGFDDVPLAAENDPPLTTVCQQGREKGRIASEYLLQSKNESLLMDAKLILRKSTKH